MTETPDTEDVAPDVQIDSPTEPGWYAYSGGAQSLLFHLRDTGQWSVHVDNGMASDCTWGYIEQALGVWTLDRIPLPVPSLNPPETLAPQRPDFIHTYGIEKNRLMIDGVPLPWHMHATGPMVAAYDLSIPGAPVHVVWLPLMCDGPLPTPPVGTPQNEAVEALTEALRLTVEYVGTEALPAIEGWSWYDALRQYAPDKAAAFQTTEQETAAPTEG